MLVHVQGPAQLMLTNTIVTDYNYDECLSHKEPQARESKFACDHVWFSLPLSWPCAAWIAVRPKTTLDSLDPTQPNSQTRLANCALAVACLRGPFGGSGAWLP